MEANIYSQAGKATGKIKLPESVFGAPWNADLVHEIVRLMNSNSRTNVAHTKTRGEVRGGGKKPWRQKGTGRARHGSTRSPIWVGGGIVHGPRNDKNFSRKINKKARNAALFSILSKKFEQGEVLFVDKISLSAPKAKEAKDIISSLGTIKGYEKISSKAKNAAIISVNKKTEAVVKSFRNFGNVSIEETKNINPVSILNSTFLVISDPEEAVKTLTAKIS